MNDKITFPRLASLLADRSGRSKRFSEDFLREFFTLISEQLEAGDSVKVKGLGTFRLSRVEPRRSVDVTTGQPMEISGHSKVVFVPAKELAEAVNAPFEAFTAIEIADDADLSQLFALDDPEDQQATPISSNEDEPEEDTETEIDPEETATDAAAASTPIYNKEEDSEQSDGSENSDDSNDSEDSVDPDNSDGSENSEDFDYSEISDDSYHSAGSEYSDDPENSEVSENSDSSDNFEDMEEEPAKKSRKRIFLISMGAAIVALIAILAVWYVYFNDDFHRVFDRVASATALTPADGNTDTDASTVAAVPSPIAIDTTDTVSEEPSQESSAEDVPTAPSDVVVYDTIGTTRYLTTMAKSHYGNYNLWPYIYEENKAKLGHPDRIRPGTPVVIPSLSKYGVDPTKPEEIEKAKKMGAEIYARYGKKI